MRGMSWSVPIRFDPEGGPSWNRTQTSEAFRSPTLWTVARMLTGVPAAMGEGGANERLPEETSRSGAPVSSFTTNASHGPFRLVSKAPGVTGKSEEFVYPVRTTVPFASKARPKPRSEPDPPRNVEYTSALPSAVNLVKNESLDPFRLVSRAPGVTGKSGEFVSAVTYALPDASTASDVAPSPCQTLPPRRVDQVRELPFDTSLVTKTAEPPLRVVSNAPVVTGKSEEFVWPATYGV